MTENSLPLLLVSASDLTNASNFISELIDNEVLDNVKKKHNGRIWQIVNKYYRANVEVCAIVGDSKPVHPMLEDLEAHIIFISSVEGEGVAERARAVGERAQVRLLVVDSERASPALLSWARRHRYEAVPLRERAPSPDPDPEPAPFADAYGVERARAALHAHPWRGLQRAGRGAPDARCEADGERAEEYSEALGEADVERAEAFAEALGALGEAREAGGALPDGERRQRAEHLVALFCRALGEELPAP